MKFAIVENGIVTNIIEAESKIIADEVTGQNCVPCSDKHFASIGGTYDGSKFIPQKHFDSWVWDNTIGWKPPVDAPAFDAENPKYYKWDEDTISWIEVEITE